MLAARKIGKGLIHCNWKSVTRRRNSANPVCRWIVFAFVLVLTGHARKAVAVVARVRQAFRIRHKGKPVRHQRCAEVGCAEWRGRRARVGPWSIVAMQTLVGAGEEV